ncbi:MAG: GNAT family N-acetyltransferase [Chloroflexota bacterium]
MSEITFLADYPETIPILSQWFRDQWPAYYIERTPADIAQDFYAEANREVLPVRLIALAEDELTGTITLRERADRNLPAFCPGLGGLFVAEQHRGRGIGTKLVRAAMNLAQELGYESIYATTVAARGILERLEWEPLRKIEQDDDQSTLYQYELEKHARKGINAL